MSNRMHGRRSFLMLLSQGAATLPFVGTAATAVEVVKNTKPSAEIASASKVHLNVRDFGAKGDGLVKDTLALQQALDRVNLLGGGEVLVPPGEYLTGPLTLRSNTTLRIEEGGSLLGSPDIADYPLTQVRWEGRWIKGYGALLSANDAQKVVIVGKGKILASAAIKGRVVHADGSPMVYERPAAGVNSMPNGASDVARQDILRHPALMEFTRCRDLHIQDVYTQGNDMWSTHPVYCENVTFKNVTVRGGADGIDVDSCKGVVIDGCQFETRDDCISLKSGRGMEGNTIGAVCEDILIVNCTFKDAVWACIGIGSETSGGIRNVRVEHCQCLGAKTFAIYIKSRPGRGAFIEDILMNDLDVSNATLGFLRINLLNSGLQDPNPVPGNAGIPTVRNLQFHNIRVDNVPLLVQANEIPAAKPLDGLVLSNIHGTCAKGMLLANVRHAQLNNIQVTGFTGPLLSTFNTSGTGLQGASPLEAPREAPGIAQPTEPFVLK